MRVANRVTVLRDGQKVSTVERKDTSTNQLISLIFGQRSQRTFANCFAGSH